MPVTAPDPAPGPTYIWPFRTKSSSQYERVDQGWDLMNTTPGDVLAIAAGTVSYAGPDPQGFGNSYAVVTLDTPDQYGPAVYYGHNVPVAANGSHVNQGDVVATGSDGPQGNATQPGWLEIGWWSDGPTGDGQAMKDTLINAPTLSGSGGTTPPSGGGGGGGGGGNTGSGSSSAGNPQGQQLSSAQQKAQQQQTAAVQAFIKTLSDPRSNLPFSPDFMTYPALRDVGGQLVRGGMVELISQTFKCYFMMNPQQIANMYNIDTNNITAPSQQAASNLEYGVYWVTNNSVNFTIYFNRMYEVWRGGVTGPNGVPGPSDIGVRWDIRALERLIGVWDAKTSGNNDYGLGINGPGNNPPLSYPVQVVFGGPNAYRFQGSIVSLDYTFTLFDKNMIPIEAYADIGIMRIYNPGMSSPGLSNSLAMTAGQYSSAYMQQPQPQQSNNVSSASSGLKKATTKKTTPALPITNPHAR